MVKRGCVDELTDCNVDARKILEFFLTFANVLLYTYSTPQGHLHQLLILISTARQTHSYAMDDSSF